MGENLHPKLKKQILLMKTDEIFSWKYKKYTFFNYKVEF